MTAPGLEVVLRYQAIQMDELGTAVSEAVGEATATSEELDTLEDQIERLTAATDIPAPVVRPAFESTQRNPETIDAGIRATKGWDVLLAEATVNLRGRGIDPSAVDIGQLLDSDEVERINRRRSGGFTIQANLDPYDILIAVTAGLTACVIDALVVRIPADTKWWGGAQTLKGSPLTKALRELSIDSDNWLAAWAKVPYDRIVGLPESVAGLSPLTHRVQTFGHDPLLGLVLGTWDIMSGSMTAVPRGGRP